MPPPAPVTNANRHAAEIGDSPWRYSGLGYVLALSGQPEKCIEIVHKLDEMGRQQYIAPIYQATIYAGLGQNDRVFEYLKRAAEERNWLVACLHVDPIWDSVRSDSRLWALQHE